MFSEIKIVLATGATGWLGSRLVETLFQGLPGHPTLAKPAENKLRVRCLIQPGQDPKSLQTISPNVEIVLGDIRNPADCQTLCADAADAILFHAAGIIHPKRVKDFYGINVSGTRNLLEAAAQARVRRAVVVSSNSPCGCNPHPDHLFDEQSAYRPYMNYGRSEMQMELAVKEYQSKGMLETVIVRPPWFYGPNQPPRQTLFFRMIREGKAPIVGNGRNLRSMGYVDNLCQGVLLAAESPQANGQTYWIADREPYSMNEIIDTVERVLERDFGLSCAHKRMRLPGLASSLAWLADKTLQSMGIYHQKIHVLSEMNRTIACSIAKAEAELNYRPSVQIEEGMRRSIEWCLATGQRI